MENNKVGIKLKEAMDHYGSLQKASESLDLKNEASRKENQQLEQKKNKLVSSIKRLDKKYIAEKKRIELIAEKVSKCERQYKLFEGLLAMLITSPSVNASLKSLLALLQELTDSGWALTATPEEMRSLFVSKLMGDHLKCFRCKGCGNKFITNIEPEGGIHSGFYVCPSCHTPYQVEPDDSFLKAMVSEKQLEDIITAGKLKQENDILKPLKPFLDITCDVCGKSITEWDKHNVKIARERALWGHTDCWNSGLGQLILLAELEKRFKSG